MKRNGASMKSILLLIILSLLISCSSFEQKDRLNVAPPQVKQQLEVAKKEYSIKQYSQATKTLNSIIKFHRNTEVGDDALLLLAKTYSQLENWPKAYSVYEEIFSSKYFSPRDSMARSSAAKILTYKLNKYNEALKLIDNSLKLAQNPEDKADLLEIRFAALMKTGSQLEAFETLVSLSENHPVITKRESFKHKAKAFLDSRLSGPELKDFANDSSPSDLKTDALYRYGVHLMSEGRYSDAQNYFQRVIDSNPKSYLSTQAQQLIDQLTSRGKVDERTIGVVLPLSGRYSNIGYETLWGLQLALGIKGGKNTENVKLAVIDSRGNPEYARKGVKRLVEENHAIAIVGGLLSKTANSAAIQAQDLGVPFIALSQKEGLTDIGPFVFRNALTVESQLDVLIDTSINKLNLKRFAVLYPNDAYGVQISNLFWKLVKQKGGTIAGAQAYLPGETDFKEPIQKLIGTFYTDDRQDEYKKRLKEWYEKQSPGARRRNSPPVGILPPVVDFDALFIPDGPKALGQIAPMLAYNDVTNVHLIGTNIWNSDEFLRRGQSFVNQSLFTDGFYEKDESFLNSNFYKNYSDIFSKVPTTFSLLGYDSGVVIRSVLNSGASNRLDFTKLISQNRGVPGALNTLLLNNKKEFIRPIVTLTVKNGEIVPFTTK
jgi:branched-chain amino acid transport system substrate-binding protein